MPTGDANPILNNPYQELQLHYATDHDGNLNYEDVRNGRRIYRPGQSAMPNRQGPQGQLFSVNDSAAEYGEQLINLVRKEVGAWRKEGYPNTTRITKELLDFWFQNPDRLPTKQLFFAQREAIETVIWLNEVANRSNAGTNILAKLREAQQSVSDTTENQLPRVAFKMATGSGKTVVMAGILLYHYFNRQEYRNDPRFADNFLLVAPGITIRDRLGVLNVDTFTQNQHASTDYYRQRGLVPASYERLLPGLNSHITIANYHQFEPRTLQGNKRTPFDGKINAQGQKQESKEEFGQVIKRLLGSFKPGSRLLVINDEAHHCYLPKEKGRNTEDENAADENARAAVWFTGLREIGKRFQLQYVYDLSATPYYLTGSGYPAYALFSWVVTDFGLIEAIESGLVKIPFLPELDNTHELTMPKLRNLYEHVREFLPKKGQTRQRKDAKEKAAGKGADTTSTNDGLNQKPDLPPLVLSALEQFVDHYASYDKGVRGLGERGLDLYTEPPVFIVVCNNTGVSREVYKYLAGYEYTDKQGERVVMPGKYPVFDNYNPQTLQPLRRPPTLLIDSDALENNEQINDDFKKVFAPEIDKFKQEYRSMYPEKSVENLTDSDLLREVVNTVGKKGALGSHIRCVVSVSMLTEGWDANTVTHIMGLRAFGSQLLCEQVAGRALRRKSYILQPYTKDGRVIPQKDLGRYSPENVLYKFPPEYAHIIGVPFKLFKGGTATLPDAVDYTHVRAIPDRQAAYEIRFPNLTGYRVDVADADLQADFTNVPNFELDFTNFAYRTRMATAFGHEVEELEIKSHKTDLRDNQVIYCLTNNLIRHHYTDLDNNRQFYKFNKLKKIVTDWYHTRLLPVGETDTDLKRLVMYWDERAVSDHINLGVLSHQRNRETVLPVFNAYNKFGSTVYTNGHTSREVYATHKSHVNYMVMDSDWEGIAAKTLDELDTVVSYVKNSFLGFQIPYVMAGKTRNYLPDFIARCRTSDGRLVNLIIEVTGTNKEKAEKVWYVENRWLPAVNNIRHRYQMDEWQFIEIANDIRHIKTLLTDKINSL